MQYVFSEQVKTRKKGVIKTVHEERQYLFRISVKRKEFPVTSVVALCMGLTTSVAEVHRLQTQHVNEPRRVANCI
jgi:hypothetical protein